MKWNPSFIREQKPSIPYLELYALCTGIIIWGKYLRNDRFIIYCDNKSVRDMVNSTTFGCKNCMVLIRLLVLDSLVHNRRLTVKYVKSKDNELADALSRGDLKKFWEKAPHDMNSTPDPPPSNIWPISKIWIKN